MVKPLAFKGDKKTRKRKAPDEESVGAHNGSSTALTTGNAAAEEADELDSWVAADAATDVTGPIIVILPSKKPTCIACDANGKLFTSELENVIEGDISTAEPHDVRQVWIANRVAGTEEINLKGHHGRYLSCDKIGLLSATREAISPEESFLCITIPDSPGTFSIRTVREKFLTLAESTKGPEVYGNADTADPSTTFRIKMQARFKPRLKANKEQKASEKISRKELEEAAGRTLKDEEVRHLKKAKVRGDYYEALLDIRAKGKHDKYS